MLLLLSPCRGRGLLDGVPLSGVSRSPVNSSRVKASTSSGVRLFVGTGSWKEEGPSSSLTVDLLVSVVAFWKGFDGIPRVFCAFGGTD